MPKIDLNLSVKQSVLLIAGYLLFLVVYSNNVFSQCYVMYNGTLSSPTCNWQSAEMGPGEYRYIPLVPGVYYQVQSTGLSAFVDVNNPICWWATGGVGNGSVHQSYNGYSYGYLGIQRQGAVPDNWSGWFNSSGSTTLQYRIVTPSTPGTPTRNISSGCVGASVTLTAQSYNYVGTRFDWEGTPSSAGISSSTTVPSDIDITGTPTTTGTFSYRYRVNNGGCISGWSGYQSFTVSADPTVAWVSGNQTVCEGGDVTFTASGADGVGTGSYQYRYRFNAGAWTTTSSTSSSTYTFISPAVGTWEIQVRYTTSGTGCDWTAWSASRTLTVNSDPTATQSTAWIQQCTGGTVTLTATYGNGTGTPSYTWQYQDYPAGTWNTVGSSGSLVVDLSNPFDRNYRVLYNTSGTYCSQALSDSRRVTIYAQPSVVQASENTTTEICVGGTSVGLSVQTASSAPGTAQYQWQRSTSSGSGYSDISGATSSTYTVPNSPASNYYYRVRYTTTGTNCGFGYSGWRRVVVNADPTISSFTGNQTACVGANVTFTAVGSDGFGSPTYQFDVFDGSTWNTVQTGSGSGYTFPTGTYGVGNFQVRVRYTTSGSGCGWSGYSISNMTVVDDPTVTFNTTTLTKCAGGSETLSATINNGTGSPSYQWQYRDFGSTTWVNLGTSSTQSVATTTTFNRYYRVIVSTSGSGCGTVTSGEKNIIVYDQPTTSVSGSDIDVCTNAVVSFSATGQSTIASGTAEYQWQRSTTSATTGFSDIGGATSASYTVPTSSIGTVWYRVGYSSTSSNCEFGYSTARRVRVYDQPDVSINGADTDLCVGATVTFTGSGTGGNGAGSYQWQVSTSMSGPFSNIGGETNASYTYTAIPGQTRYFRVAYSTSSLGCGPVYSDIRRVSGYFDPEVTISGSNTVVCVGASVSYTGTGSFGSGTSSYQWEQSSSISGPWSAISGATNATYAPSTSAIGVTYYRVRYSTSSSGCDDAISNVRSVEVVADPNVSISGSDVTVCVGTPVSYSLSGSDGTGAISYAWESSSSMSGPWTSIPGANASSYSPSTASVGITYYRGTYSRAGSGCDPATSSVRRVEVVEDPSAPTVATQSPNQPVVCAGTLLTLAGPASGGVAGLGCEIQYRYSVNNGASWISTGTTIPSFGASSTSGLPNIIQARRANCSLGCDVSSYETVASWDVVPQPEAPTLAIGNPNISSVCIGTTLTLSGVASGGEVGDGCSIQYRYSTDGGTTWSTPSTSVPSFSATGSLSHMIQARRASCTSSCNDSPWNTLVTWSLTPNNTIALTSAPGTDSQTICILYDFDDITYSTSTATGATFTGLPTGVTGSWNSNQVLISGSPSVAGTYNYTVNLTGGCNGGAASGTITALTPVNNGSLTWIGVQDVDWDNEFNWDCRVIPTIADDVIIQDGMPFDPTILGISPTQAKCNTIVLQGSVVLTIQESLGAWLEVGN